MQYSPDQIAQRCSETSNLFLESMVELGIPHGSEGIYADYFSFGSTGKPGQREETCATSHEYLPLGRKLAMDVLNTEFRLEHVRTFHDELDFLQDLEISFAEVKNGFADGLRRCVDLHRCIPSATVTDDKGRKLCQSHFETRFAAIKQGGTDTVSILLSIEYSSSDAFQESGEMEVCNMPLDRFLERDAFESLFHAGLAEMLERGNRGRADESPTVDDTEPDIGQEIDTLLAAEDFLPVAEMVNDRAAEIDFGRILDIFEASIHHVKERAAAISERAEATDSSDNPDVGNRLQAISASADSIAQAAVLCEAVVKAMIRLPRLSS